MSSKEELIDRALILTNDPTTTIPIQLFQNFIKPSQIQRIETKYFTTKIQLLYDEFIDFDEYVKDLLNDETKILRDLLRLIVIVVKDITCLNKEILCKILRKFELEDMIERVNFVIYLDTTNESMKVDELYEDLLEEGCFWEIITNYEEMKITDEKFGIERLKEMFHNINWTIFEDDKSIEEKEEEEEEEKEEEKEEDFDIMTMLAKIQDFKIHINSIGLKDSEKHDIIMKFIDNLHL